jgi:hypothetical protein
MSNTITNPMSERIAVTRLIPHNVSYSNGETITVLANDKAHARTVAKTVMQSRHGVTFGGIPTAVTERPNTPAPAVGGDTY